MPQLNRLNHPAPRSASLQRWVVTAAQMRAIEARLFAAGLPEAALMEKVAGLLTQRISSLYPLATHPHIGVLVGPGHNGGDALVVARELWFRGYQITLCCPFERLKDLTASHLQYAQSLGMVCQEMPIGPEPSDYSHLADCDGLIDGLFGIGLDRDLTGPVAALISQVNEWQRPVISIDLPSGLHTDSGQVMGQALRATHTLCLGLWKLGLLQDQALAWTGQAELIDFDVPRPDIQAVLGPDPAVQQVTAPAALAALPLPRPPATHKYQMGHLLLIVGSRRYMGAALLAGLSARASGVGMLSIAVPASLQPLLAMQLPEALIRGCPETPDGAIAQLSPDLDLTAFQAIACGPGLTAAATAVLPPVLASDCPLVLDADGLNILAQLNGQSLQHRAACTLLTPHLGEFRRLFPTIATDCRVTAVTLAAQQSGAIVLLKGARLAIGNPQGQVRLNPASTPALSRGGSGDVLTGLLGGLLAQAPSSPFEIAQSATWWHAQAGLMAAQHRTELGVDAHTLTQFLIPALHRQLLDAID
jgi:ADP-dependent NAD(P)H-hydrate dehydratase / NAD(P)H-hydrate epimerase